MGLPLGSKEQDVEMEMPENRIQVLLPDILPKLNTINLRIVYGLEGRNDILPQKVSETVILLNCYTKTWRHTGAKR